MGAVKNANEHKIANDYIRKSRWFIVHAHYGILHSVWTWSRPCNILFLGRLVALNISKVKRCEYELLWHSVAFIIVIDRQNGN